MIKYFLYAWLLATFLSICVECDKLESKKKEEAKYVKGHLQPLGESGDIVPIEVHSGFIKPELFYHEYVQKAVPVVFKGAAVDMPAYKLWTDEYIRKAISNDTSLPLIEVTLKEEDPRQTKKMLMKEFLNHYKNETYYMVHKIRDSLKKDLVLPWSVQCQDYESILKESVMWFSNGGTKSKLHVDHFENINCLFRGKKSFLLVDNHKYWHVLPKILDRFALSNVDVDAVDLEKYPDLRGVEFLLADIEAGDCIYIPIFFMHYVKSFENNLAVNLWWLGSRLMPPIDTSKCSASFDLSKTLDKFQIASYPMFYGDTDDDPHFGLIAEIVRLRFIHEFVDPPRQSFSYSKKEFIAKMLKKYGDRENFKESVNLLFKKIDTNKDGRFTQLDRLGENTMSANITWVKFFESFDIWARRHGESFSLTEPLVGFPPANSDIVAMFRKSLHDVRMKLQPEKDEL